MLCILPKQLQKKHNKMMFDKPALSLSVGFSFVGFLLKLIL